MSYSSLSSIKKEFLEIGEYNFTWPGENGTFQDFGTVNYTMPTGKQLFMLVKKITIIYLFKVGVYVYKGLGNNKFRILFFQILGPWYWPWCPLWRVPQHPLFQVIKFLNKKIKVGSFAEV